MSEDAPNTNQASGTDPEVERKRQKAEYFRKHRVARRVVDKVWHTGMYAVGPKLGMPRKMFREILTDPSHSAGYLRGSVLSPDLFYPDMETGGLLREQAAAGRWAGWDFHRPTEFPHAAKKEGFSQLGAGWLALMELPEVMDKPASELTPTTLPRISRIDHLLSVNRRSLSDLVELGFLQVDTYASAYNDAGLYDDFEGQLNSFRIHDERVYTVTPKGNAVVNTLADGGRRAPDQPEVESVFEEGVLAGARIA